MLALSLLIEWNTEHHNHNQIPFAQWVCLQLCGSPLSFPRGSAHESNITVSSWHGYPAQARRSFAYCHCQVDAQPWQALFKLHIYIYHILIYITYNDNIYHTWLQTSTNSMHLRAACCGKRATCFDVKMHYCLPSIARRQRLTCRTINITLRTSSRSIFMFSPTHILPCHPPGPGHLKSDSCCSKDWSEALPDHLHSTTMHQNTICASYSKLTLHLFGLDHARPRYTVLRSTPTAGRTCSPRTQNHSIKGVEEPPLRHPPVLFVPRSTWAGWHPMSPWATKSCKIHNQPLLDTQNPSQSIMLEFHWPCIIFQPIHIHPIYPVYVRIPYLMILMSSTASNFTQRLISAFPEIRHFGFQAAQHGELVRLKLRFMTHIEVLNASQNRQNITQSSTIQIIRSVWHFVIQLP